MQAGLLNKELGPVRCAVNHSIANANRGVIAVQNVGAVAGGIHPVRHNGLWCALTISNVLTSAPIADAALFQRGEASCAIGTGV